MQTTLDNAKSVVLDALRGNGHPMMLVDLVKVTKLSFGLVRESLKCLRVTGHIEVHAHKLDKSSKQARPRRDAEIHTIGVFGQRNLPDDLTWYTPVMTKVVNGKTVAVPRIERAPIIPAGVIQTKTCSGLRMVRLA